VFDENYPADMFKNNRRGEPRVRPIVDNNTDRGVHKEGEHKVRPYGTHMGFDSDIHHRRSVRLKGYDYSSNGAYFVTICTERRERLFGGITNDEMMKNEAAKIVETVWRELPERFPGVVLDIFVVMPNHFHGIIFLS